MVKRTSYRPGKGTGVREWLGRYGLAVAATTLSGVLRGVLPAVMGPTPYLGFYPAVVVSAALGGTGPGLVATFGSLLLVNWFGGFDLNDHGGMMRQGIWVLSSVGVSVLAGRLRGMRLMEREQREALAASVRRVELLAKTAGELLGSREPQKVVEGLCRRVMAELDCQVFFNFLVDGGAGRLHLNACAGIAAAEAKRIEWLEYGVAVCGCVARDGCRIVAERIPSTEDPRTELVKGYGIKAYACHPLLGPGGEVLGTLSFGTKNREVFSEDDLALMKAVTDHVAVAMVRQRGEEAVRVSEEKFAKAFGGNPAAIAITRLEDGRFVEVNETWLKMMGYTREEVMRGYSTKLHMWPRAEERAAFVEELRRVGFIHSQEQKFVKRSGEEFTAVLSAETLTIGGETVVLSTLLDISESKRAEERLRLQVAAMQSAHNAIVMVNRKGEIEWVNQAFTRLTGYGVEEAVGRNPRVLNSGRQGKEFFAEMWGAILAGRVWHGELVNRRKDGEVYSEEMTITPVTDEAGTITHFIAIKLDITARKAAEEAMAAARTSAERAKAEAEEANKAKDHFLAVLSHELRTPLTPVMTTVAMLQGEAGFDPTTRERLEVIRRNVEMEARLIDDLLDVTRIARGKIELERKQVRLCEIIHRAVEVVQPDVEARRLHLSVEIPDARHLVHADAARLQQVFWNLLRNAVKFTPQGGCVGVTVRDHEEGYVTVEVRDSGEGIDPGALSRIFNAFEQGERSITRQFGGLGLGLTISKALVEMHGGSIAAHSAGKGKGATFQVRLPVVTAQPSVEAPETERAVVARSLNILLVEDHGDTAKVMEQLLKLDGHVVTRAGDVATALALAERDGFDLILSDLGLPDKSGLELMRELRGRGCKVPGIALSGYGMEEDLRRSKEAGFAAHLTKPTRPERLAEAIARVLGGRG